MCGPRFSPGRGFGQKSRRGSRDLAGTLPATTACARGVGRGNRRARSGPMPRQATFPAWPFLGPAASFAAGSSARRLVERNGARQRRAARPSAAPPRGRCSANSSKSASVSSLILVGFMTYPTGLDYTPLALRCSHHATGYGSLLLRCRRALSRINFRAITEQQQPSAARRLKHA